MNGNWREITLGEITDLVTKGTTPTSVGFKFVNDGVNFIKVESLTKEGTFIKEKFAHIEDVGHEALSRSQLRAGDILFSIAGALGRTAIVIPEILPANTNQALAIIRLKSSIEVLPSFVVLALSSGMLLEQIEKQKGGVAQQNLSLTQVKNFKIPLPPLPEQKHIVTILDEAFVGISQAVANAEKNLANARELFESYLNKVFTEKGEGWEEAAIGEIANHCLGKMLDKKKNRGVLRPYLRNLNVRWFDFDLSSLLEMRFEDGEHERYSVRKGDVLICEGGYPGRAAIWLYDEPMFFQKALHRVRFYEPLYNRWFLYFIYLSDVTGKLREYFTGAGIQHFTGQSLRRFKLPLAPIGEIKKHIENLDKLIAETQYLETLYQQKLTALTELKQSILQKAFSGALSRESIQHEQAVAEC